MTPKKHVAHCFPPLIRKYGQLFHRKRLFKRDQNQKVAFPESDLTA